MPIIDSIEMVPISLPQIFVRVRLGKPSLFFIENLKARFNASSSFLERAFHNSHPYRYLARQRVLDL